MRKWYRLTALVLAFAIVLSTVSGALAQVEVDYSEYLRWVEDVKAANGLAGVISIDEGGEVLVEPSTFTGATNAGPQYTTETTQNLGTYAADSAPTVDVALEQYGKVTLAAPAAGQWQAYLAAADLWVNITGETGSTFELTFAKVQSLFAANGHAQLRCLMGDKATETVNVGMSYSLTALPSSIKEDSATLIAAKSSNDGIAVAADETTDKYTVVIEYAFSAKSEIPAEPYSATLAAGTDFSAKVKHPTIQGYVPTAGESADWNDGLTFTDDAVEINVSNIDENKSVKVIYQPTNVNYTVIHKQQNVVNDEYTVVATETLQGQTDSIVPEVKKDYPGFYSLLYEKPAIAADGSTVVEVYYDRNYYLMNFDLVLEGAYGTEPVYARYGADLGTITNPTCAGYTFKGWSLNGTDVVDLPPTMPAVNSTYKAVWEAAANAKVTVVFWGETANCTDEAKEYDYYGSGSLEYAVGEEYTYGNEQLACTTEEHTHNDGCIACGKQEHTHSLENGCYQLNCTLTSHNHADSGCTLACNHTHTIDCYRTGISNYYKLTKVNKPTAELTHAGDGIYTYTTGSGYNRATHYYVNIGNEWYRASNSDTTTITLSCSHSHDDECYSCGLTQGIHTHSVEQGCYDLTCDKEIHTHSAACYGCGKVEHTHTADCVISVAETFPTNLWTKVESETKTVLPDGTTVVNVYYDRTEFTLTYKYNYNRSGNPQTTETITAKWGADISDEYEKIAENANNTFWTKDSDGETGPFTNYFEIMPQANATYYCDGSNSGSNADMTYWGQDLNGQYTVKLFTVTNVGGYSVTIEDRYVFEGFTYSHGTDIGENCGGANFYYNRNSYTLDFNNGIEVTKSETVKYEAPLSTYTSYTPTAPIIYEEGSVKFDGWYLNPECTGDKYDLTAHTMPAANLILYAKWVPVTHTVEFYLDRAALTAGTKIGEKYPDLTVNHGEKVDTVPAAPQNGSYKFIGWFYLDEKGEEKAFDFNNMPVNRDMKVYGKWSSDVLKKYTVKFMYKDDEGKEIEIGETISGQALAGFTKTFDAKGGDDLYTGYQAGYFPLVQSHSMYIDINATEENDTNVFIFWYVQKDEVPYIVRYVDKDGNELHAQKVIADNRQAVVTENFEVISGYMPDAYQKRLVVNPSETEEWITVTVGEVEVKVHPDNVITFVYVKDEKHAYYKITHYTEDLNGTSWTEYASSQAVGDIGESYTGTPMDIDGFTYTKTEYVVDGNVVTEGITENGVSLTSAGLEINLYYERNVYPYQVRYLEQGSGKKLAEPKDGSGLYSEVISENAIDITNYTAVDPTSHTLTIKIEESTEAKLNIITFYYTENEVTINYVVVGPDGCGTVDLNDGDLTGKLDATKENVKVVTGTACGAKAEPTDNTYRFVGWYTNEECTGDPISTDASYVPAKNDGKNVEATYYAKFEYNLTTLTIKKDGMADIDNGQSFLFKVTGEGLPAEGLLIAINGNGSETISGLTVGQTYTVTEVKNWSWRYNAQSESIKLDATGNEITIKNTRNKIYWLDGDCYQENVFGGN